MVLGRSGFAADHGHGVGEDPSPVHGLRGDLHERRPCSMAKLPTLIHMPLLSALCSTLLHFVPEAVCTPYRAVPPPRSWATTRRRSSRW
jgi:hypothetical protein